MADRTLNLPYGNRNATAINPQSTSLLARLRSLSNVGAAPSQRALDVMTGDDAYEPTEGELIQQQLAPVQKGGGTYEAESGNTSGVLSRDLLREAGAANFKRKLRALSDQYIAPEQIKGQTDLLKQGMANSGNLAVEQQKGADAARTAAVPRTVTQNINTNKGAAAGDAGADYANERGMRALDQINYLLPKVNNWSAGIGGRIMSLYPGGSQSRELKSELESLKSQIGFKELNEMRAASKTGGALGQVSDVEERLLSQSLGGLDQANDPETLKQQLMRIQQHLQKWEIAKRQYASGGQYGPDNGLGLQVNVGGGIGSDPYGMFGE
jgi:hypothetical protein